MAAACSAWSLVQPNMIHFPIRALRSEYHLLGGSGSTTGFVVVEELRLEYLLLKEAKDSTRGAGCRQTTGDSKRRVYVGFKRGLGGIVQAP